MVRRVCREFGASAISWSSTTRPTTAIAASGRRDGDGDLVVTATLKGEERKEPRSATRRTRVWISAASSRCRACRWLDDSMTSVIPMYRHLWPHAKDSLPKKGRKADDLGRRRARAAQGAAGGAAQPLWQLREVLRGLADRRRHRRTMVRSSRRRCSSWCATTRTSPSLSSTGSPAGSRRSEQAKMRSSLSRPAISSCSATSRRSPPARPLGRPAQHHPYRLSADRVRRAAHARIQEAGGS